MKILKKFFFKLVFITIVFCFFIEIFFTLIFSNPIRFVYPLFKTTRDIQTDFDVKYHVERKSGNRIIDCNNRNNSKNENIIFIGDSMAFGQGLDVEDTFVYLYACKTGYQVKNLSAIGIGIEEYREIILNQDLADVKLVYLIFILSS